MTTRTYALIVATIRLGQATVATTTATAHNKNIYCWEIPVVRRYTEIRAGEVGEEPLLFGAVVN